MKVNEQDRQAFLQYMNEKARAIGMEHSHFNDPVGMDNRTTALDLAKLLLYAHGYRQLDPIWRAEAHTVTIRGPWPREKNVVSTFAGSLLKDYYKIIGGKTGTLNRYALRNLAVILEDGESEGRLAVVVLGADDPDDGVHSRFEAVRQVVAAALQKRKNPTYETDPNTICCEAAAVCLVSQELQMLYEKKADSIMMPASVTKILTAISVIDIVGDLNKEFTFEEFDTQIGRFYREEFLPGDVVTFEDALYSMMLPSINVSANAVANRAGQILREKE